MLACNDGEIGEDILSEEQEFTSHPMRGKHNGDGDGDELHGEAQRLLLNLRKRLEQRDQQSDECRHHNGDERQLQDENQRRLRIFQ